MWNLEATVKHEEKKEMVSIITSYYNPDAKRVHFIALLQDGKFIDSDIKDFLSVKAVKGFIKV